MTQAAFQSKRKIDNDKALEWVGKSVGLIGDIIHNVRKIEAVSSGKYSPDVSKVCVGTLISELLFVFEEQSKNKNIEIKTELPDQDVFVLAEKNQFTK